MDEVNWTFTTLVFVYLVAIQLISTLLIIAGWLGVRDYVRRRPLRAYDEVARSPLSLPVSLLVPAFNEEATVVGSTRALLDSDYLKFELVVVNDGSTDTTAATLIEAFDMYEVKRVPQSGIETQEVIATYISRADDRVHLVDKRNGGKADALNAAINYARYPLICALDADTLLDQRALARLVWEFESRPETVATGGIVRVFNGSTANDGQITQVRTPREFLPNLQIIEYLRAFLGARIGWSRFGMLLIISGAFGLFRRSAVVAVGGYDPTTVGEDSELVLRLHRHAYENHLSHRITFFPDPICWTEVPDKLKYLARQRDRWQRGLAEMLWKHRSMFCRPKYGRVGLLAMPYFLIFELLGPVLEVLGYLYVILGLIFGFVSPAVAGLFFIMAILLGILQSLTVIFIEEQAYKRYLGWIDLTRLTIFSVLENVGYRQYLAFVRLRALFRLWKPQGWGEMQRSGFTTSSDVRTRAEETKSADPS